MVCRSPHVSPVAFCPIDLFNIMFNTCFYKARKARSSFETSHVMVRGMIAVSFLVKPYHSRYMEGIWGYLIGCI